jgi:prepilin-type processing-associated H-X9-DG protein
LLRRMQASGFTAVELLVVVGIIMVLAGLGLSAIQRVRATASRIRCADNLRQIGLALHAYHGSYGAFPAGCDVQGGEATYPLLGWAARLLPYVDQEQLWRSTEQAFIQSKSIGDNPPHVGLNTVLPVYTCPADERTHYAQKAPPADVGVAFSSYLGVAGIDFAAEDGMLFTDSAVQLSEVTDGASNTLMVGERPPSADLRFGWWYGGSGQDTRGSCDKFLGVQERNVSLDAELRTCARGPYEFAAGAVSNQCDMFHFWSLHPGGSHFLLVDGSVHFITYSAAPIMPALASRAGGEAVAVP